MILDNYYFEEIFKEFEMRENLGIASGSCFNHRNGKEIIEKVTADHTRGGLKTYRYDCYKDIGGIRNVDGWDGLDNEMARMKGWMTMNFKNIKSIHRRETGSYGGKIRGNFESGKFAHFMGYFPPYMLWLINTFIISQFI